jgi:hypothetical protein
MKRGPGVPSRAHQETRAWEFDVARACGEVVAELRQNRGREDHLQPDQQQWRPRVAMINQSVLDTGLSSGGMSQVAQVCEEQRRS